MIVYAGDGGIKAYDTVGGVELWTGKPATSISVSADSKYVAALYRNEDFATVYDAATGRIAHEVSFDGKFQRIAINDVFANPNDNLFALNHDGTMLGVSFADGSMWVYNLRDSDGDIELYDNTSGFTHFEGGFYQQFFAFSASKPSESLFAVIDTVELVQTGGFDSTNPFGVQADKSGIYVQTDNIVVKINPVTGEQTALVTTFEKVVRFARSSIHTLMTTKDEFMFFDANAKLITRHEKEYGSDFLQIADRTALIGSLDAPVIQIMKYESHPSAEVFFYDPSYRHDEARLSADGQTAMLFSYDGFRLFEMNGRIITEVSIPDANHLYDQQYRRDESGSRLEVIYNDGTIRAYSAIDGSILYEIIGEKPDLTLYEEFFTDTVRIESPLHGRPAAYNLVTGELIRELEKDAYLTYATQVGEYIITEYVTGDGFRYGLLLNSRCETLAYLPYLCDFVGDKLVFDYPTGDLRESRIYDINELIGLAR
jgi:WD40 repeat protein